MDSTEKGSLIELPVVDFQVDLQIQALAAPGNKIILFLSAN